jgi:hypothetical protein
MGKFKNDGDNNGKEWYNGRNMQLEWVVQEIHRHFGWKTTGNVAT